MRVMSVDGSRPKEEEEPLPMRTLQHRDTSVQLIGRLEMD